MVLGGGRLTRFARVATRTSATPLAISGNHRAWWIYYNGFGDCVVGPGTRGLELVLSRRSCSSDTRAGAQAPPRHSTRRYGSPRHPGTAATSHTLGTRQRLRLFRRYLQRGIIASSFAYLVMEAHNFLYDEMMCLDRGGRGAAEAALCYLREEDARAAVPEGGEATATSKEAEADTGSIYIANRRRDRLRRQAEWAVSREDVDAARTANGDAGRAAASGNGSKSGSEQPARRSLIEELDHDSAVQRWRERLFARARGAVLELGASSTTAWRNLEVYSRPKYNSRNDHSGSVTKVCACDIDARGLAELERRVLAAGAHKQVGLTFVAGDAESRLPFPDASFDTVTMSFLLSFVTDPVRVLDEATRVLKKNGRILLLERGASAYGLVRYLTRGLGADADADHDAAPTSADVVTSERGETTRLSVLGVVQTAVENSKSKSRAAGELEIKRVSTPGMGHFYLVELEKVKEAAGGVHVDDGSHRGRIRHNEDLTAFVHEYQEELEEKQKRILKYDRWKWNDGDLHQDQRPVPGET